MKSTTPNAASADLFDPADYQIGESIGYLLARAKNTLSQGVEQEVGALDMTHAQASCLMMLAKGEATTVTDLARNLNTDAGSVTRLLNRMEKRGLIARTRRDDDRRVVELSITPEGNTMLDKLPAAFCNVMRRHFEGFTQAEIDTLRGMLLRVIANNQGGGQDGCPFDRNTG
ncbi:MarR family winged helix-turn-helix transcriptional regulator [Cupriavidus pauculus]|uniref:MarR family winged helix-turn-helix transcriptional regulator n=1 Tax=Cupriavidus pauculus TaxID=82633 RepID=UPI001EE1B459|nr:MarR family transcriptional regulator [Cupriavidus pauculus]GJG95658.1 MarR family transcriptional regulator [Cupriavidus pauculus]